MATEATSLPVIEEEEFDDGFYEKIEAPKFVDFTTPEIRRSHEDRYWFCLRVGCDRNHEEELDSEAIYKNFVLRVMAARSPNVRLRKALNQREKGANLKCPLTVPAKSSKSRVSRLALISSFSKKITDDKARTRPPSKVHPTPKNEKVKQSSTMTKAFTTARNQKKSLNFDQFRTVQSQKSLKVAVPKNRVIAKTLVFHSPKKVVKIKTSVELKKTPMKSLCSAMKKLEIDSVKKKNDGASRRKIKGREVKSRVFDSLYPNRCLKEVKKLKDPSQIHEGGGSTDDNCDSSDMEIDEKSRDGSLERCNESSSSEEAERKKGCEESEDKKENIPEATKRNDNKENSLASDDGDKENQGGVNENDDKENVSAFDENRTMVINHENLEKPKNEETRKTQKKPTSNATVIGAQVVKYKKLRPTNPKPFKLRTDERGILKEANLEKKPLEAPLKETVSRGGKMMRSHHHLNQKIEQDSDNKICEDRMNRAPEENKSVSIQCSVHGSSNMKVNRLYATSQKSAGPKFQKLIDVAELPKLQDQARKLDDKVKGKSHMTQPTLVIRSRSVSSRKKENGLVTPNKQKLSVIDEKSSNLQPNEEAKACNDGNSSRRKAYSANSSSRSRPKMTITVPKEPNFQSLHMPKSCTKKLCS